MFKVPTITTCSLQEALLRCSDGNDIIDSVLVHFLGDITGRALLVYPSKDAKDLVRLLAPKMMKHSFEFQKALLREVSNIFSSAYMNAFGKLLGFWVIPTMPEKMIFNAPLSSVLAEFSEEKETVLCAETEFRFKNTEKPLRVHFFLLPDKVGLELILKKVHFAG
jgi:chemotaxis protein CheY-P-specific phosphatase CheC